MSYQGGYQYQDGYQSGGFTRDRRHYENIGSGAGAGAANHGQSRMQTMEVLSGKEYVSEFESQNPNVIRSRWAIYIGVALLMVIALMAPHKDDTESNFNVPKNQKKDNTSATAEAGVTSSPVMPEIEDTHAPRITTPEPAETTTPAPTKVNTVKPIEEENKNSTDIPAYAASCAFPNTFRTDSNNFTYLNVSDFCQPFSEQTTTANTEKCTCHNPANPTRPSYTPEKWNHTMAMNIALINQSLASKETLDVVFIGDSITEHWNGRDLGEVSEKDYNASVVFQQLFQKKNGSSIEGLALGIAGDRCQNLLYRLRNGEMPEALKPKVWWLLIGTNDLGMDFCTADATAAGNIRIVEEIRRRHPTTPIVINSLLPRNSTELLRHNPYWKTISAVNHRLDCYAKTQQNVEFFNATDIFIYEDNFSLEDDDDNDNDEGEITEYYVNKSLMNDYLHPSGIGAMKWGQAIAKKVQALTEDSER